MKKVQSFVKVFFILVALLTITFSLSAAELKGTVSVTRNNARQITGATLNSGSKEYNITMDENGKSLAEMYEHKELKVSCTIEGANIKVDTWEEIKSASSPEPAYNEPAPRDEPSDEPEEEVKDDEPKDEPSDESEETVKDDEPKDEEPKDEEPKDEEPKDEEPKDGYSDD